LVAVLQLPSTSLAAITPTAIPTIMRLAPVMKLVDPLALVEVARSIGFALVQSTRVTSAGESNSPFMSIRGCPLKRGRGEHMPIAAIEHVLDADV
jgi:hypothetical protein